MQPFIACAMHSLQHAALLFVFVSTCVLLACIVITPAAHVYLKKIELHGNCTDTNQLVL